MELELYVDIFYMWYSTVQYYYVLVVLICSTRYSISTVQYYHVLVVLIFSTRYSTVQYRTIMY